MEEELMETFIDKYINQGMRQGLQQGLQQGMQQGMQQGWMQMFTRLIEARFGKLPAWAKQKIELADMTTIENWSIRLLKADKLEDVLGGGH